jgi:hypothetical protein
MVLVTPAQDFPLPNLFAVEPIKGSIRRTWQKEPLEKETTLEAVKQRPDMEVTYVTTCSGKAR